MGTLAGALGAPFPGEREHVIEQSAVSIGNVWHVFVDLVRASLLATAPVAPLVAAVIALAAHVNGNLGGTRAPSLEVGVVALGLAWGGLALLHAAFGLSEARRANPTSFCELSDLLIELSAAYEVVLETAEQGTGRPALAACKQVAQYKAMLEDGLHRTRWIRAVWVLQMGYVSAWQLVHRAQEALIALEDDTCVALRAQYDRLRLAGARIDNKEYLTKQLDVALQALGQPEGDATGPSNMSEVQARHVVTTVRRTLNEYVDENRAGLVRARMHLTGTMALCGLIGYGVLCLAMAAAADGNHLVMAAVFFAVGALVGLVSRLQSEIGNDTAVDDFGLSGARLLAGVQLSGLAAVLGVGLLALLGVSLGTNPSDQVSRSLDTAFALSPNPINIVTAAVFGLTPGLLIDRLKQQTDGLKQNLRSAEPQVSQAR